MVNLVVDLRDERFAPGSLGAHLAAIEAAGFAAEGVQPGSDAFVAWIDHEFGGTWSSEAFAGSSIVAKRGDRFAGFATFAPRGMRFSWLRGLGQQPGVGIFGPFGVAPEYRGSSIGPHLLMAALAGLAEKGFERALIPAVGHERLAAYYIRTCGAQIAETFEKTKWQARSYRTVVLASGSGTNFQSVIDGAAQGRLPLDITTLVSNNPDAFALERARRAGVRALCIPWDRATTPRSRYDDELCNAVAEQAPELLLLLGWMHLLSVRFVTTFQEMINIHPAFLPLDQLRDDVGFPDGSRTPAFRGPRAVKDALAWGSRWVGATSHRVTPDMDRGPVLVRAPMQTALGETEQAIMQRLHPLEHTVLARGIMRWIYER